MIRVHDQAAVDALTDLALELRPSLALSVAESLVREALDDAADAVLDVEWARTRQQAYPGALRLAHSRHMTSYEMRRARELVEARIPRVDEFHGRVACRCLECDQGAVA